MVKKRIVKFNKLIRSPARNKSLQKSFKRVLSSGYYILGQELRNFEEQFARFLGIKYCIGVGNGQEALQISLMALGIGAGDEVITTPISAVATTLAILAVGAKPVFVDTNDDGLIDPDLIPKAISKKTKAILPVHLYGNSVNLKKIMSICKRNKLFLIEDACQAHGATYNGKKLGTFGILNAFSFYPTKNLGAFGDGGAIVTNSVRLAKICRQIRDYGQYGQYNHVRYGLNSRLDELHGALLSEELKHLDEDNKKRRNIGERYIKNLGLTHPEIVLGAYNGESIFHLFVIKTKKAKGLRKHLSENGIQALRHYPRTIPDQPFLKSVYGTTKIPIARNFVKTILSLPCYPNLKLKDVNSICQKIIEFNFKR